MTAATDEPTGLDTERLRTWLRAAVEPSLIAVDATRIGGGNSSVWKSCAGSQCGVTSTCVPVAGSCDCASRPAES